MGTVVDRHRNFPGLCQWSGPPVFAGDPAAERHRFAAHRAHARAHRDRRYGPLASYARRQHPLASRHRSRGHRHADAGGTETWPGRSRSPQNRPRGVRAPRLGVEGAIRRHDQAADDSHRSELRLVARALYARPRPLARRPRGLRPSLRKGPDLPRRVHGELVPALPHRAVGPRGAARPGARQFMAHPLSGEGRCALPRRGDDAAGDHARRHRRRRQPQGRALPRPARHDGATAADEPRDPHYSRRGGGPAVRNGRGESHPGARFERLRGRTPPQPSENPGDRRHRAHDRRSRPLRRSGPLRSAHAGSGGPRGTRPDRENRALRTQPGPVPALQNAGRAAHLDAVVREDKAAGRAGDSRGGRGPDTVHSGELDEDLLRVDVQHPRLVHLAPALCSSGSPG